MASKFFIQKGDQIFGPMSGPDVKTLAQSGKLMPNDLVWKEGSEKKVRAEQIKGLSFKSPEVVPSSPAENDPSPVKDNVPPVLPSSASKKVRPPKTKPSQTSNDPVSSVKTEPDNSNDRAARFLATALWALLSFGAMFSFAFAVDSNYSKYRGFFPHLLGLEAILAVIYCLFLYSQKVKNCQFCKARIPKDATVCKFCSKSL